MKQKIFRNSLFVGVVVLLLFFIVFCALMYTHAIDLVYSEMSVEASYAAAGIESVGEDYLESLSGSRRITLVAPDGTVLFDNRADAAGMDNHLDRSEIADALAKGSGRSKHFSGTMGENTLYYAVLMNDGRVLRVSAPYENIFGIVGEMLRPVSVAFILVLILCALISSRLSRQITEPINAIDLEDPGRVELYPELEPLVRRVREQNRTIRLQMDELGRKQREFSAITENMSEGLILFDAKGEVVFSNSYALEAVGGGKTLRRITRASCGDKVCSCAELAMAGEEAEALIEKSGRILQLLCSPVVSGGQVTGAVILILDVTEREKRDELRREFSANVSHELKTPLTSISGFAELMKEGLVPQEKMQEFSGDIYRESRRLLSLVEDIMRLSRLEEGIEEPENEYVELLSLAGDVVSSLSSYAESHDVELHVSGCEAEVYGSRRILGEIIYNLCDNAVKYNVPKGHVYVTINSKDGAAVLSVRDTGIGIPADHQGRVFERFYRVDKSHSKETGGTGLGLSIVRHGAAYHDAEIVLKSHEGCGSEFTLIFPVKER
ncbi:MAG: histidine kinase [Oscillospiraceae bacterium]|nr:histidine kinase [Oscillospiraceae bacterium]